MIKKLINILMLVALMMSPALVFAQPIDPGSDPDPNAPINGGVVILLIVAFAYGVKVLYSRNKKAEVVK
jgi:hypothetical protein